jgi:hypothetical protein
MQPEQTWHEYGTKFGQNGLCCYGQNFRWSSTKLHGFTSHKIKILTVTSVNTSKLVSTKLHGVSVCSSRSVVSLTSDTESLCGRPRPPDKETSSRWKEERTPNRRAHLCEAWYVGRRLGGGCFSDGWRQLNVLVQKLPPAVTSLQRVPAAHPAYLKLYLVR